MIKVIMIVVTAIFLSSWYACLVAGKRADEEISAFPDHYRSQRGDFKMLRRYAESAWIPDTGAEPGGNGAV